MEIIIHRGTRQIGGCVTEIRTAKTRLIFDFGSDLPNEWGEITQDKFDLEGLTSGIANCNAVFFSHYHADHVGRMGKILSTIPLYFGRVSKEILKIALARRHSAGQKVLARGKTFLSGNPLHIGDLKIRPLAVDHSAYDANMFLVEKDNKKVLFTGDFRLHGFRGKFVKNTVKRYARDIDLLITEGTLFSRPKKEIYSEWDLQKEFKQLVGRKKYVFVLCSSTNIDRLGTFCNNTPRGRYFICDDYQKKILELVAAMTSSRYYKFEKAKTYGKNLPLKKRGFVMAVRSNNYFKGILEDYLANPGAYLVYSMWRGYLDGRNPSLTDFLAPFEESGRLVHMHSSGHADFKDLEKLIAWTGAKRILPIHTDAPEFLQKQRPDLEVVLPQEGELITLT